MLFEVAGVATARRGGVEVRHKALAIVMRAYQEVGPFVNEWDLLEREDVGVLVHEVDRRDLGLDDVPSKDG